MSNTAQAQATYAKGIDDLEGSQAALEGQKNAIEDARGPLAAEAQDSKHPDSDHAVAQLGNAVDAVQTAQQSVAQAIQLFNLIMAAL